MEKFASVGKAVTSPAWRSRVQRILQPAAGRATICDSTRVESRLLGSTVRPRKVLEGPRTELGPAGYKASKQPEATQILGRMLATFRQRRCNACTSVPLVSASRGCLCRARIILQTAQKNATRRCVAL